MARLAVLGLALIALCGMANAADYPMRWTERVALESLDQVGKLLVEPGLDLELFRYDRARRQNESKHVDTCREFLSA